MRAAQIETTDRTDGSPPLVRGIRGSLLTLAACAALAGCGFAPLYAQPGVVGNLAAIDVEAPEGRTGFLIREHLDDAFAKNRAAPAAGWALSRFRNS